MILHLDISSHDPAEREKVLREHLLCVREKGLTVVLGEAPKPVKACVFDLDATLIPCEFIDTLAARRGLEHLTRPLTARAMNGEMDFRESYTHRLEILKGTPVAEIESLIAEIPLAPGAEETIRTLKGRGIRTAIITGGYARPGRAIQSRLGIDALYATELEEADGYLTGRTAGDLLDEEGKVAALKDFCTLCGCTPCEAVAVGDGANDIKMLASAGLAILYTSLPSGNEAGPCKKGRRPSGLDAILKQCL